VSRPALEVADIFRDHGAAWRAANAGHVSLGQMKVMSAIESCRTAALGGHVARCEDCQHTTIRRFLTHVLPKGFHRIRHYGLLAGGAREERLAQVRELLEAPTSTDPEDQPGAHNVTASALATPCPCCGGRMIVIETFEAGAQPGPTIRIDTS
jgi:transposase-like zinc-binding protein/putative transposase